jgi:hypothetical protein
MGSLRVRIGSKENSLDTRATGIQNRSHPMCKSLTTEKQTKIRNILNLYLFFWVRDQVLHPYFLIS